MKEFSTFLIIGLTVYCVPGMVVNFFKDFLKYIVIFKMLSDDNRL